MVVCKALTYRSRRRPEPLVGLDRRRRPAARLMEIGSAGSGGLVVHLALSQRTPRLF